MSETRLPKSSKRLVATLADRGQMTQKELIQAVGMPAKTVRYALKRLNEARLIVATPNLQDMRSMFYILNPDYSFRIMEKHIEEAQALMLREITN
ncbi:MAG: MarR family transcriptional regulator [Candidatus Kariarchaeaceae archaeon]